MTIIQGQITSCASSISQAAGLVALAVSDEEMQASFDVMREKAREREQKEEGLFWYSRAVFSTMSDLSGHTDHFWSREILFGHRCIFLRSFRPILWLPSG